MHWRRRRNYQWPVDTWALTSRYRLAKGASPEEVKVCPCVGHVGLAESWHLAPVNNKRLGTLDRGWN